MRDDLSAALRAGGGVLSRRRHPELASTIDWHLRAGRLRTVLPGVYAAVEATGATIELLAAGSWRPEAALTGPAAAKLSFWPDIPLTRIDLASPTARPETRGRFRVHRRRLPPELVRRCGPLQITDPALTALDLCDELGGDGIDAVLRTRTATLAGLWQALASCPDRPGNAARRELLRDSRSEPWSAAERVLHRLLRAARISGWQANHRVVVDGRTYYLDVAFADRKIAIEVDGRAHHGPNTFEADRWRQNDLVLSGWLVLRFTWAMLIDAPDEVIAAIAAAVAARS